MTEALKIINMILYPCIIKCIAEFIITIIIIYDYFL